MLTRLVEIRADWTQATSALVIALGLTGLLASFFPLGKTACRPRLFSQSCLVFIPLILVVQRPNPWARTWFSLYPLLITWSAAGLVGLATWFGGYFHLPPRFGRVALAVAIAGMAFGAVQYTLATYPGLKTSYDPIEQSALYIRDHLQEGQVVVITAPDDAPMWYYFYKYNLPQELLRRDIPFDSAYVVVDEANKETLQEVVADRGPDSVFFEWDTARVVASFDPIKIYQVDADQQIIQHAYSQVKP